MAELKCEHCDVGPAACWGSYEGSEPAFACDVCCGHGCEDGRCYALDHLPKLVADSARLADVRSLADLLSRLPELSGELSERAKYVSVIVEGQRRLKEELDVAKYNLNMAERDLAHASHRVVMLEKEVKADNILIGHHCMKRDELSARLAELEQENARLREGLGFYADWENWKQHVARWTVYNDCGARARALLDELGKGRT